ncbi:MAG TPA: alpha/beta hydrolase domain-containing protein [Terriglobales bacterium]|nr:alpha/beta hydrolase domain-containing protein [Terriglobales bacterium]
MNIHTRIAAAFALFVLVLLSATAFARVDRFEISSRADVLNGKPFGAVGPYEKISGRVYFKVKPEDAHNKVIVDLDNAAVDDKGEVEFSADVFLLKPKDMKKANGALLLEIPNRGGKSLLRLVNGGTGSPDPISESDFGDGWLLRQGYVIGWLGWQWDVTDDPGNMRLYAPIAYDEWWPKHLTGLLRSDFTLAEKRFDMPLGHLIVGRIGGREYPVTWANDPRNTLTVRDAPTAPRRVIPKSAWSFAHEVKGKLEPSNWHIHLKLGFDPGKIYELVYAVDDPVVVGLGLAAVRDFVSYVKYDKQAVASVTQVYALGISQTGRFLRHFLYEGFNADEQKRQVLDGVLSHVAGAGRGSFNHRFAQPSRDAQPMSSIFYPTDIFPFTDLPQTDAVTGETAGLLDKAFAAKVAPKIFYSNTSYEYWGRAGSLIHTIACGDGASPRPADLDCVQDAKIPENVRIYLLAGLQHFSGPFPPELGKGDLHGQQPQNPNPVRWLWRAMISNMNAWVRDGVQPPPNNYPRVSDGTLVPLRKLAFPRLCGDGSSTRPGRGTVPSCITAPTNLNEAWRLDFGPEWKRGIISKQPPEVGKAFPVLVPQVDADGNDRGGVRIPEMMVPIATYTGWNLRHPNIGAPDQRVSFLGSYIPFAKTAAESQKTGDPRLSLAERYKSREDYLGRYKQAAEQLVKERWLLQEDVPAVMERGAKEWEEVTR